MIQVLRDFLGPGYRNALLLVNDKRVVICAAMMKPEQRPRAAQLNDHVRCKASRFGIPGYAVAHPAKEAIAFNRLIIGFVVAVKALLAEGHPNPPHEWFFDSVDRYFKDRTYEVVGRPVSRDGAQVAAKPPHALLLLIGEAVVMVWRLEGVAWGAFMDLPTTPTLEREDCSHK